MVYGDTGRYPLYAEMTISFFGQFQKLGKMPLTRVPQANVDCAGKSDQNTPKGSKERFFFFK